MSQPIWERLPSETSKAFEAFACYRDMGVNRSLDNVSQELNKSVGLIARWSGQNNWVNRVGAYDDHCEKLERQAIERQRIENKRLRIKTLLQWQDKLMAALEIIDTGEFSVKEINNGIAMVVKEFRTEFGEDTPTTAIEINNTVGISSTATRAELIEKLKRLAE